MNYSASSDECHSWRSAPKSRNPAAATLGNALGFFVVIPLSLHSAQNEKYCLWFAEKPACINVASQAAWWDSAKIVHASGVRAVVKAGCSRPPRKRIIARWRRTISRSLILLDNLSG